jgi:limonene-1,2-epoxide hydrolase
MTAGPAEIVTAFIQALQDKDLDTALGWVTDDIVYDNVPMDTVHGKEAVRSFLEPMLIGAQEIEWIVHRQVAAGTLVMNERTDGFRFGERWVRLPVAGVFEFREGRIALWRDYFDLQNFTDQLTGRPADQKPDQKPDQETGRTPDQETDQKESRERDRKTDR